MFLKGKSELKAVENEIYLRDISQVFFEGGIQDTQVVTILTRKNRTRKVIMENDNNLPAIFMNNLRNMHIKVSDK